MSTAMRVGTAMAAGYLLGRTRKLKLAITVGGMLVGQRIATKPTDLLKQGRQLIGSNPELANIEEQLRTKLLEAAKAAALATLTSQMNQLSDTLHERSSGLRGAVGELEPGGEEQKEEGEPSQEQPDEQGRQVEEDQGRRQAEEGRQQEDETDAGRPEDQSEPQESQEQPGKQAPRPRRPAEKSPAPAGQSGTNRRSAEKKPLAKKAAAKKAAANKATGAGAPRRTR